MRPVFIIGGNPITALVWALAAIALVYFGLVWLAIEGVGLFGLYTANAHHVTVCLLHPALKACGANLAKPILRVLLPAGLLLLCVIVWRKSATRAL